MATDTSADTTVFERRESQARSYCRAFPTVFTKASGSILSDAEGRDYIDFLAGCSSLNYGHNDADMKAALIDHISRDGVTHGLDMFTDAKAAFLETFERLILTPRGMDYKVMMTGPTGTNAVEAAIKLARKVTGRRNIVAFTNAFHGMTMGSLALTGNSGKRDGAGGGSLADVTHMPFENAMGDNDTLEYIEWTLDNPSSGMDAPAAFIVEPVQGEGGLNAASAEWLQGIQRLARKHGALFIIDDIQAGIGRTGTYFSTEEFGLDPDMITQAKSFSGMGLPFAALLIKPEHDIWKPAEHNGTFRGNNHAFVTARIALEKFWSDDRFAKDVQRKGDYLHQRLQGIAAMVPGATLKGRGMMLGVDVGDGELASQICATCFDNGLIIETSGAHDEVVKVLAPLTTPDEIFTKGLDILEAAVAAATGKNQIAAE
ncbi:diaminobutyrate--2-oxoglutarate transaminase [Paracoccus tegillarcae]|uniref:Diaminobutyrate--2-oxoglutarate transaminase n=1 Tax=Paracoccus tegillarcae TaxID=1529068 RepID=A0A2K9EEA6_9RHOB|nr:diaminobutyrate--2-oxoglutarate transaminase [Paracoccus tegillarcae]AUH32629.1 diaminobutyrate--2-oxoglutarate transaminase [Paracoccus tegillarcae]